MTGSRARIAGTGGIGILVTGDPPGGLAQTHGDYADMFTALVDEREEVTAYRVHEGKWPERAEAHRAYLITGSAAGVYEPLPWIADLIAFLRGAKGKAKLVGICFGHQVMAEAFGGKVEKSERGWGIGLHRYVVADGLAEQGREDIAVPVSHQDQVVVQPPATSVIASSAFTPFAGLAYQDQPALSLQCHPEFTPRFASALIEHRRGRLPNPDAALASLTEAHDCGRVRAWIRSFLAEPA